MKEYLRSAQEVLKEQESSAEGLRTDQVERRRNEFGPNRLAEGKHLCSSVFWSSLRIP